MNIDFLSLAHDNIKNITPYQPGGHIQTLREKTKCDDIIKLASNENPLGMSPSVATRLSEMEALVPYYPDSECVAIKRALSNFYQIESESLMFGSGSEELIRLLVQTFNRRERHILFPQYAFLAYKLSCQSLDANFKEIKSPDFQIDLSAIANNTTKDTAIIFLANPNNPTGDYFTQDDLVSLLNKIPSSTLLVMDEAYYEYAKDEPDYPDTLSLQSDFPNLVILRTFSKSYGLAGLRIGYCIATPALIEVLHRVKLTFNVSAIAQAAALQALSDQSFIQKTLDINNQGMSMLKNSLDELKFTYLRSPTNFLTVDLKEDTYPVYHHMLQEGLMLRTLHPYGMPNHLRISIGLPEQMQRLTEKLTQQIRSQS